MRGCRSTKRLATSPRCAKQRRAAFVAVDAQTVQVLRFALDLSRATDGLFDVTIGRQLVATKFLPRMTAHPLTYYNGTSADIEIVDESHVVCHRPMLIDLGGILP